MPLGVKWLKHSQKRSHLSCNAWTYSFLNTVVHPTMLSIQNTGLEEASWNCLHHSLLKQGKHYLDIKRHFTRLLNCSRPYHKTLNCFFFFFIIPLLPAQTRSDFTQIKSLTIISLHTTYSMQILTGLLRSFLFCSHTWTPISYVLGSQICRQLN